MSYGESKIGTLWRGYYITAYGIAVKHGFKGTEEEWLESLVGKAAEIRYNDVTNVLEWSYAGEDVWTELLSLEELQTEVVAQTLAQAEAAKQAAQDAQAAAEAAQSAAEAAQQEAEQNAGITQADASITQTNVQLTQEAKDAAETAQQAAQNAQQAAEAAGTDAEESATLSKSWAVGGTGTRPGEDTNNAEYWAKQAAIAAGGGVLTFNGRTGNVTPEQGDYTPDQVGAADQTLSNLTNYQRALHNIGGRPNRNLLDNWYFVGGGSAYGFLPVNQKGKTAYDGYGYTIDQWKSSGDEVHISADLDYLNLSIDRGSYAGLVQVVNKDLRGLTITLSALLKNVSGDGVRVGVRDLTNDMKVQSVLYSDTTFGVLTVTYTVPDDLNQLQFAFIPNDTGCNVQIKAVKLEIGDKQTLAYQDSTGNWNLFETPNYSEELARCQRYLRTFNAWTKFAADYIDSNRIMFSVPGDMRADPAVSGFALYNGLQQQSGFAFEAHRNGNNITVVATKNGHGLTDAWLGVEDSAYLSAEL